nr:MAG TPA: hypothetical protein [Caudoviricetes sp.]
MRSFISGSSSSFSGSKNYLFSMPFFLTGCNLQSFSIGGSSMCYHSHHALFYKPCMISN